MAAETPRRRGRPRRAGVEVAVADATLGLLREGGPGAVTMEAVAARAGIAKTTLYRRHADRTALLHSVLATAIGEPVEPDGDDPRAKLRWALGETWRHMADVLGRGGLAALLADSDPAFTATFRQVLAPYDQALTRLMARDVEAGHLRAGLDTDGAVTLFLGAYVGELVRRGVVADDWLDRCLELMWGAIAAPDGGS